MLATQPRQKRWPHGIVCGCCSASRQMAHSASWLAPAPPPLPCAAPPAAAGRGAAAASFAAFAAAFATAFAAFAAAFAAAVAALGFSALTHLFLWPAFQCCLWQAVEQ
jgi:hypothetical protein